MTSKKLNNFLAFVFIAKRDIGINFEVEARNFEFTKHVSDEQHPSSVANTNEPIDGDI